MLLRPPHCSIGLGIPWPPHCFQLHHLAFSSRHYDSTSTKELYYTQPVQYITLDSVEDAPSLAPLMVFFMETSSRCLLPRLSIPWATPFGMPLTVAIGHRRWLPALVVLNPPPPLEQAQLLVRSGSPQEDGVVALATQGVPTNKEHNRGVAELNPPRVPGNLQSREIHRTLGFAPTSDKLAIYSFPSWDT